MKIELPLSSSYVYHWTVYDALRELFQNGIDQENKNNKNKLFFSFTKNEKKFIIGNKNVKLGVDTLVLGNTDKALDKEALGQYGEGYKLALIVLLRHGLEVTINNADEIWTPKFEWSEQFKCKILTIEIQKAIKNYDDNMKFVINGLRPKVYFSYSIYNLHLQPKYQAEKTSRGEILYDERFKGRVYVEGLYVCNMPEQFYYGFNFNAGVVPLDRDRRKLSSWDVSWESSRMFAELDPATHLDEISALVESKSKDVEYIISAGDKEKIEIIADGCFDRYQEKHGDFVPVENSYEENRLKKQYENIKIRVEKERLVELLKKSKKYEEAIERHKKRIVLTPKEVLVNFLENNKELFPEKLKFNFLEEIINKSNNWVEL